MNKKSFPTVKMCRSQWERFVKTINIPPDVLLFANWQRFNLRFPKPSGEKGNNSIKTLSLMTVITLNVFLL